jgi:flagellar basal-body rod protein FlgB
VIDSLTNSLEHYMDLLTMRQKLVSSNIANADTPGYKTQDLDFQDSLNAVMDGGVAHQIEVKGLTVKNDGNNVDLDREARLLSENDLRFSIATSLMKGSFTTIKEAIKENV